MAKKKSEALEGDVVLIKKYANRRLYNTQKSSYVTLDDLANMIKTGEEFVVQDAKSGDDLTRGVLTQIIFDAENNGNEMLPTNFLRDIIRLYGDTMQGMVPSYLEQAMANFAEQQEKMRESFEKAVSVASPFAGFEQLSKMNSDWIKNSMKLFQSATGAAGEGESPAHESNSEELRNLKAQLNEMQAKLSKLVDE